MKVVSKVALGLAALVGVLALGTSAQAQITSFTVDKCLSAKLKTLTKGASAYAACHSKDSAKPDPVKLGECLSKNSGKITSSFTKTDGKYPLCTGGIGNGGARDADAASVRRRPEPCRG